MGLSSAELNASRRYRVSPFSCRITNHGQLLGRGNQGLGQIFHAQEKIDELVDLLEMRDYAGLRFDEYSMGIKQHLAVARSLHGDAQVLFMDEPTSDSGAELEPT
jgi:ABC-type Na+ transport system ATPase subunit NatA